MYHCLQSPLEIRGVSFKNRLVLPPLATEKTEDGFINKELLDYYRAYAEGGNIGTIVVEHTYISADAPISPRQISSSRDEDIEGLRRLASVIKMNGSRAFVQINHGGSACKPRKYVENGVQKVSSEHLMAPSAIGHPNRTWDAGTPHELTKAEIAVVVDNFARAAERVKKAGFDGVVIHGAHGYLLNQFFCPLSNMRTDEYGGSVENRIRIHVEIVKAIRERVGDFIISSRFGGCDYKEGGATIEEAAKAAILLEQAGVDILDLSGGMNGFTHPDSKEAGWFKDLSMAIRKVVNVPIVLTGGVSKPEQAETLLKEDVADFIGVGRALMQNQKWADEYLG